MKRKKKIEIEPCMMSMSLDGLSSSLPSTVDLSGALKDQIREKLLAVDATSITELILDGCMDIDLETLSFLDRFPNLNGLSLQNCRQIDSAGLTTLLGNRFSSLTRVNLSGCDQLNGLNLAMIVVHRKGSGLPSLRLIS
jgi:hypothetical protein